MMPATRWRSRNPGGSGDADPRLRATASDQGDFLRTADAGYVPYRSVAGQHGDRPDFEQTSAS